MDPTRHDATSPPVGSETPGRPPLRVVLMPNCAFLSETTRMIAIARRLPECGAEAIVASHGGQFEHVLDQEGVPWRRVEPAVSAEASKRFVDTFTTDPAAEWYTEEEVEERVRGELAFFDEVGVDAVVSGFTLTTVLSARGAGIPLVVTHMGSFLPILADLGRIVARDVMDVGVMRAVPVSWLDKLLNYMYPRMRTKTAPFVKVAERLHIDPVLGLFDLSLGDLTLATDVPEILGISEAEMTSWRPNPKHRLRPSQRLGYAGAIFATLSGEVPPSVEAVLATEGKTIFVALNSTTQAHVEAVYTALSGKDARVIMVAPPGIDRRPLTGASNILIEGILPSHLVMPRCDLAVIHGGQGSVQTAIASGTPFVGIPLQPEQGFNVLTIQGHGAARSLSLRRLAKGQLGPLVDEVLADTSYKTAMVKLQAAQATRDGPLEAARATVAFTRQWKAQANGDE